MHIQCHKSSISLTQGVCCLIFYRCGNYNVNINPSIDLSFSNSVVQSYYCFASARCSDESGVNTLCTAKHDDDDDDDDDEAAC